MNFRKILYIFLAATIAVGGTAELDAARKKTRSKARTTATSKKRSTKKRRTTKKRSTVAKAPTPPPDPVLNDSLTLRVNDAVMAIIPHHINPGGLRVNSVRPDSKSQSVRVGLNENFTYLPVTRNMIDSLTNVIMAAYPDSIANFKTNLYVGNHNLAYYITKVDKLPAEYRKNPPFVTEAHPLVVPSEGMENDLIALWHSHGKYYKNGAWQWQRPLLFETVEDMFPMGYVLPYLTPMLENAGAYVFVPRERDINPHEVIVDNDINPSGQIYSQPYYKELNGSQAWTTGEFDGFIYDLPDFRDTENPFENGTYRQVQTVRGGRPSVAAWCADIPEDGEYAVYVSYKTLPNSTTDARYTVNYSGGSKEFIVNQTMGGSTWIYLGTFPLEKGYSDTEPIVSLTNLSTSADKVVTADAVKIGGGMGNIARSPRRADIYYDPSTPEETPADLLAELDEEDDDDSDDETTEDNGDDTDDTGDSSQPADTSVPATPMSEYTRPGTAPVFRTSGLPRYLEGARYWLHWAGVPERVYSPYHGADDYKDDYTGRAEWVNYLAGGSRILPGRTGLNLPIDLTFALHTDAGKRADDSYVGTLGIYFTQNGSSYVDGTPRINSRMLTDIVMRQIVNDIRKEHEPNWTRRSMWDKSYVEARVPEVPTTLIELMSHQNFADMQYGLDPAFRFTVARAIYKGLARFLAERKDRKFVVQPLPVKEFAIARRHNATYRLSWQPTPDPLEPTAMPDKYIIMQRNEGDLGFHKLGETSNTHFDIRLDKGDNEIHSFRIIAVNKGGSSFPSETLSLREAPDGSQPVLIVNGFSKVSAPAHHSADGSAGFDSEKDFGVPYIRDISFTGHQMEYRRNAGESFGRSASNYVTQVIAGNTFDYPAVHGEAFANNGYGFVSASASAVSKGKVNLHDYKMVDLILGKQKRYTMGSGHGRTRVQYQAFPESLQKAISEYLHKNGKIIISGQYVASDLLDSAAPNDSIFATEVLGISREVANGAPTPTLRTRDGFSARYSSTLNDSLYIVERPDILLPAENVNSRTLLTFGSSNDIAGLQTSTGKGTVSILSVPLEAIEDSSNRARILKLLLE